MSYYKLAATQYLSLSKEEAWAFLSDPKNLSVITPPKMGFKVLSGADRPMYAGQIIQYKVSPFRGVQTHWVTEITHVQEGLYFVDEQRFGPYALWHHKHFIQPVDGGVCMEDLIDYKLPFGILGQWMHPWLVKKQLHEIFMFRAKKLSELFGTLPNQATTLEIHKI